MPSAAIFLAGFLVGAAAALAAALIARRRREEKFARMFSFALHELNTPVTAVNMTVLNLQSEVFGELPVALKPWIEVAREQVGRLKGLVGELRDFLHLELHRDLRAEKADLTVDEILDEALAILRHGMEKSGVEFRLAAPNDLPSVRTDPERAARCLTSVLFHARKFRIGGPIELKVSRVPYQVLFAVSYEGTKLEPEEAAACLDLYYPSLRRKSQVLSATGLGLGFIRRVARLIGGDLDFASGDDGRAIATLSLPSVEARS